MNLKMAITTYPSIITLHVNGLNDPIKRHNVVECITKQDPYIFYLQETHFRLKDTHRLKEKKFFKRYFMQMETNKQKLG